MKYLPIFLALGALLLAGCMSSDPVRPSGEDSPALPDVAPMVDSTSIYGAERGPNLMGSGN
jgi:PBP1b-binding outer membrane lipoprotein LpoB